MRKSTVRAGLRLGVVGALTLFLTPLLGIAPAQACSCVRTTEAENYQRAEVVFKGTVESGTESRSPDRKRRSDAPVTYVLAPTEIYKGKASNPQAVRTSGSSASCGVTLSGRGHYLVFANRDEDGRLAMNLCGGTRPIGADEKPKFTVAQPTEPTDQDPGGGGSAPPPDLVALLDDLLGRGGAEDGVSR